MGRLDQIGRDDDDEFGFLAQEVVRAEQLAEHRHILQPRNALHGGLNVFLQQPGDRHRATGGQLDAGFGPADIEARHDEAAFALAFTGRRIGKRAAADLDAVDGREIGHFGADAQRDIALRHHYRREIQ